MIINQQENATIYEAFSYCMEKSYRRYKKRIERKNKKEYKKLTAQRKQKTQPAAVKTESKTRTFPFKKLGAAAVLCALLGAGAFAAAENLCITDVWCETDTKRVVSFSADAKTIVEKSGIPFTEEDALVLDFFSGEGKNNIIIVAKPHTVSIYRDGKYLCETKSAGSVENALKKSGVKLKEGDSFSPTLNSTVAENLRVDISSGFAVTIKADGKTVKTGFKGGTVIEALTAAGITLSSDDIVSPARDKILKKKTTVTVKRVTYEVKSETVETSFETVTKYSDSMFEDESRVETKGKNGKKKVYSLVEYTDGTETNRVPFKTETLKEKKDKVIVKGTKKRPMKYVYGTRVFSEIEPPFTIELDEANRPVKYEKIITGKATAYCGGGITATGQKAMPGRIAVNPRQIPYGTKMYVVSSDGKYVYGYCVASDTGGFVKKRSAIADLYMHSYDDCMQFGRRNVDIYILEWG